MAFYIYNLGPVSARVQEYADVDGWIPEAGDNWQDFHWPHSNAKAFANQENGKQIWQEFLERAIAATSRAIQSLEALEEN